jgi:branched-chain amino acid transport system permease protein
MDAVRWTTAHRIVLTGRAMLSTLGQLIVSGIAFGAIYALIAVAFSLIYRSTRTINFAQGHLAMCGAYVTLWAISYLGLPYIAAALVGIVAVAVISVLIEVLAFRPLYKYGTVFVIVSSIGLGFVIETALQMGWGAQTVRLPAAVTGGFSLGAVVITWQQLLVVGGLFISVVVLEILLHSRLGRAMRASAENAPVASLMGIRATPMTTLSFALAGVLTGIAGILVGPLTYLQPTGGTSLGLLGVVAAIVGGLGSIPGAVLGGFLIGLVNVVGAYLLGGGLVETATFGILVATLLIAPRGLLGEEGTVSRA